MGLELCKGSEFETFHGMKIKNTKLLKINRAVFAVYSTITVKEGNQ